MPSSYRCSNCDLRFVVGWAHDSGDRDGYGATSHLVCSACGTEYEIEIALRDRGPERLLVLNATLVRIDEARCIDAMAILRSRFDMTIEEARAAIDSLPMAIAHRVNDLIARELQELFSKVGTVRVDEVDSMPNPLHGPIRQDRFLSGGKPRFEEGRRLKVIEPSGARIGMCGEFALNEQPCTFCCAAAPLIGDPAEITMQCPHCHSDSVECVESWTT